MGISRLLLSIYLSLLVYISLTSLYISLISTALQASGPRHLSLSLPDVHKSAPDHHKSQYWAFKSLIYKDRHRRPRSHLAFFVLDLVGFRQTLRYGFLIRYSLQGSDRRRWLRCERGGRSTSDDQCRIADGKGYEPSSQLCCQKSTD